MASSPEFVPSQPRAGLFRRLRRRAFALVPFAVWCGGVVAVLFLVRERAGPLDYPGIATGAQYSVVAPAQGRLDTLLVGERSAVVGFEEEGAMLDKDFVLYYALGDKDFGLNLLTYRPKGEDGYFALMLAPRLDPGIVDTTYACLPGRGSHSALLAFLAALRRHTHVLCLDVRSYFLAIDHAVLLDVMARLNRELNVTFVFATHDPQLMERAQRLIRLVDGAIETDDRRSAPAAR